VDDGGLHLKGSHHPFPALQLKDNQCCWIVSTLPPDNISWVCVQDGHFVPNLTIGAPVVQSLRKHSDAFFDCHLMVTSPQQWVQVGPAPTTKAGGSLESLGAWQDGCDSSSQRRAR